MSRGTSIAAAVCWSTWFGAVPNQGKQVLGSRRAEPLLKLPLLLQRDQRIVETTNRLFRASEVSRILDKRIDPCADWNASTLKCGKQPLRVIVRRHSRIISQDAREGKERPRTVASPPIRIGVEMRCCVHGSQP